jgi:DNA relaxase NicK
MTQTVGIDWLTMTSPMGTNFSQILPTGFEIKEAIEPTGYYDTAYALSPAGRIDWNSKRAKQGMMVRMTGGDLRTARASGMRDEEIVASVSERKHVKFTRIDLAIDLTETRANPDDLFQAFQEGKAKTRVKNCTQIHGYDKEMHRTGNTVNIGSRSSQLYIRAYDKALESIVKNRVKEQELIDTLRALEYKRIEVEIKDKAAQLAARAIGSHGVQKTARATIEKFVNFPTVEWWSEMIELLPTAETGLMVGENNHSKNSQTWLYQQALPAVIKAIRANNWYIIDTVDSALGGVDIICANPKQLKLFDFDE